MPFRISSLCCLIIMTIAGCRREMPRPSVANSSAQSKEGMVVSAHPLATKAGVRVLQGGGNAMDAAVAVHFTLAVVYPRAGNLGGGGFMLIRSRDGSISALDFREKAPADAHENMFLDSSGNVIPGMSTEGVFAAGVPGSVAGLYAAHSRFGSQPWKSLFIDAIAHAERGHLITVEEAQRLNEYRDVFIRLNGDDIPFVKPTPWHPGDLLVQHQLAKTLQRIAEHGPPGFYQGQTADAIASTMDEHGGLLRSKDLLAYEPVWRVPLTTKYKSWEITSMPPPSSGGIVLAQILEMTEPFAIGELGFHSVAAVHLMVEAERRAFADRAEYLGDPDFVHIPQDSLLDSMYLADKMDDFNTLHATRSDSIDSGIFILPESFETTHYSVADSEGNVLAITTTLNANFGSKVFVREAGFFLNNEMDDFSIKPGIPNLYGLVGSSANKIEPHKRMLSSMTPTIVERDGDFVMTLGTNGGSTIITSVFQVMMNILEFEMTPEDAVAAKRFHHQWLPDQIIHEEGCFPDSVMQRLIGMGHSFEIRSPIGYMELIVREPDGTFHGVGDAREGSHAEGL